MKIPIRFMDFSPAKAKDIEFDEPFAGPVPIFAHHFVASGPAKMELLRSPLRPVNGYG
jgi:hypothetical protein